MEGLLSTGPTPSSFYTAREDMVDVEFDEVSQFRANNLGAWSNFLAMEKNVAIQF